MTTVLHIDDDPFWREEMRNYLGENGIVVVSTAHIKEAEGVLETQHIDAIVCDGNVDGEGDGTEFADRQARLGRRVIAFCVFRGSYKIPFTNKGHWLDGECEKILAFVKS